jgi:hypothetical protein
LYEKRFRKQGDLYGDMCSEEQSTMTANNVCTSVQGTSCTNIHNKIVSNFEVGEVQASLGSYLAE